MSKPKLATGTARRRRAIALAAAAAASMGLGGSAVAGHLSDGVKSYTGCLTTSGGTLSLIKEGDTPQKNQCPSGSVIAHFSGGDITAVAAQAGGGLSGGASDGAASLSLRRDCADAGVLKWNSSTSAWDCGTDGNSTYTGGTGIDISGNEVSIEPGYRVKNTDDCDSGKFATGFDSGGEIQCGAPASSGGHGYSAKTTGFALGGSQNVLTLELPAGAYLLLATGSLYNKDLDSSSSGTCALTDPAAGGSSTEVDTTRILRLPEVPDPGDSESFALSGTVAHQGGPVYLNCTEGEADVDVAATLHAIKLGALN